LYGASKLFKYADSIYSHLIRRRKNIGNSVKFKHPCFHRLKICESSRRKNRERNRSVRGIGEGGISTIVGIANVWHKRLVKTSWETPPALSNPPRASTDRGRRGEGARDEGNEARNRISRSSASRRSSFRKRASPGSHSREVKREIMHWTAPLVRGTEKCHWLPEFRVGGDDMLNRRGRKSSCSRITRRRRERVENRGWGEETQL